MPDPHEPMSTKLSDALNHIIENWKTTVSAVLTTTLATGTYFAAVPANILQQNGITQHEIFIGTVICGLAKVYLSLIQKDAK